jgi:uncharacterized protein (TIGR02996 family)
VNADETLLAILRRVIAEPDVDLHRLVYADRLDELNRFAPAGSGLTDDKVISDRIRLSIQERWEPQRIDWTSRWWPLPKEMVGWYERGFYRTIECDASTFLKHADELIWHEVQTAQCRKCRTSSELLTYSEEGELASRQRKKCVSCNSTGRVPRPCPPSAQPIRAVRITGGLDVTHSRIVRTAGIWFTADVGDHGFPRWVLSEESFAIERKPGESAADVMLRLRWPGVVFEFSRPDGDLLNNARPGETFGTEATSDDTENWGAGDAMNSEGI